LNVEQCFREFRAGRRPFPRLIEALKGVDETGEEGRAEIEACLADLVDRGAFPNDLAITIRATLDMGKPAVNAANQDFLDPPTEPRPRVSAETSRPEPRLPLPRSVIVPADRTSPSDGSAPEPPADAFREKIDEVVLSGLASDFRGYRRAGAEAERSPDKSSDRQLDAALASFRGARIRRDATKSSEGAARPFDFTALAASSADKPVAVGAILKNRFVLDREIGKGGMGVVYRAVDRRRLEAMHNQPYVAVKLLTGDIRRSPDALRALEAEARRAQELSHPHIVNTYDFDRDGSHVFIVMELLEGRTLDTVLRETSEGLGFEASRPIVDGICAGLAYAHDRGVIHCDLKPANIFVENGGGVKVLDFGIATAGWAGGFDLSSLNAYTVAYASPEALRGDPRDPRDDVYALACLVYVALTGSHPFDRASALEARDRGLKPARPARIPGAAWEAVQKGLVFDRANRLKNAAAFRKEYFRRSVLDRWLKRA
jgi:hypothetical protein